jgi:multisubunit Na+/H+ antiporter MnhB subunit
MVFFYALFGVNPMKETFYKGAMGNLSLLSVTVALSALAANGTKVLHDKLPIGTQVTGIRHITAALGGSTAIKVELVDPANTKTELLAVTTTSADVGNTPLKPTYIGDQGASDLVLTNTGGSAATGEVTIQLEYRFKGY